MPLLSSFFRPLVHVIYLSQINKCNGILNQTNDYNNTYSVSGYILGAVFDTQGHGFDALGHGFGNQH